MDSEYLHICARCRSTSKDSRCSRDSESWMGSKDNSPCESIQAFVVTATPVDVIKDEIPPVIYKRAMNDMLILGSAFIETTYVERVVHGEKRKYPRWIHYPAEKLTIGQLNTWAKRHGFTKYTK